MTIVFSTSRKFLLSILAATTALSSAAFAQGGDDPISGIDIIMKKDPSQEPIKPVSFGEEELKKLNSLKGMDRPALIAGYAAQYAQRQAGGAAPKGGWDAALRKGLIADWNVDERGGSTTIKITTLKPSANYIVTVTVQSEGESKEASQFDEADALFAKRAAPTPQKMDAISYGSTRSNKDMPNIAAPSGGTPDLGDVTERADTYGSTRSNRGSGSGITAPRECVTVDGAVDANCDGVADPATK